MSKEIDSRIVEMKFDNKNFESNVQDSLSTLEKLKQKLKFDGASKGFENLESASRKVSFSPMSSAVDSVKVSFSALEVMAVTALANITNQAVNAGKKIISSLTIDPIKTGFQEYETQINAVQTILANTSSKGTTLDQVNASLDELNTYADKTIYNFTEMTRNIGTFTAAGTDLDTSVQAIQGIANLAAVSGSNAQQASTGMYQLSQALSSGTLKLMDWNSVTNAGMGGQIMQDELKKTARAHGVAVDEMIADSGSFRESLKNEWITAEVLTDTLKKFTTTGVNEYIAENSTLTKDQIANIRKESKTYDQAADSIAAKSSMNRNEIKDLIQLSQTAEDAATKVKTFTQLKDTVKEAVQSGWGQTWRTLIGDFDQAKTLFTSLSDVIGGIVSKSADRRNAILSGSMTSSYDQLNKKITDLGGTSEDLQAQFIKAGKAHGVAVDEMIEKEGSFANTLKKGWVTKEIMSEALRATTSKDAKDMEMLSDATLRSNTSMGKLAGTMSRMSGRELVIESFKNVLTSLGKIIGSVSKAWYEAFPRKTAEEVYGLTVMLHNLSEKLIISDERVNQIGRTFRGLFSILEIFTTLVKTVVHVPLWLLGKALGKTNLGFLGVTARIGDTLLKFSEFVRGSDIVNKSLSRLVDTLIAARNKTSEWTDKIKAMPEVQAAMTRLSKAMSTLWSATKSNFGEAIENFRAFIDRVKEMDGLTLVNLAAVFTDFRDNVLLHFFDIDGLIKSATTSFNNFQATVANSLSKSETSIGKFKSSAYDLFVSISNRFGLGDVLGIGLGVGTFVTLKKTLAAMTAFKTPVDVFKSLIGGMTTTLKAMQLNLKAKAILSLALAIGVLAASVVALSFVKPERLWGAVGALFALAAVLAGVTYAMSKMDAVQTNPKSVIGKLGTFVAIGIALALMAAALKVISTINDTDVSKSLGVMTYLIIAMVVMTKAMTVAEGTIVKGAGVMIGFGIALTLMVVAFKAASTLNQGEVGKSLGFLLVSVIAMKVIMKSARGVNAGAVMPIIGAAVGLYIFVKVLDKIAGMDLVSIQSSMKTISFIMIMYIALIQGASRTGKNAAKSGAAMLMIAASILALVYVIELLGKMDTGVLKQGLIALTVMMALIGGIIAVEHLANEHSAKAGLMIGSIVMSIAALTAIMVVLGNMDKEKLTQGLVAIGVMELLFMGLIAVTKLVPKDIEKTLGVLTVAIVVLSGVLIALALLDPKGLKTASIAIGIIMATFTGLIAVSKFASEAAKNILPMVGVFALLAAIMVIIGNIPTKNAITNSVALAILLVSMTVALYIMSQIRPMLIGKAMIGLAGIAAIAIVMAFVLKNLSSINAAKALVSVIAMSILLGVLTAIVVILTLVGPMALVGIVVAASLIVLALLLGVITNTMNKIKVKSSVDIAIQLSTMLLALAPALAIIALLGLVAPLAIIGTLALIDLMVIFGVLFVIAAALIDTFPGLNKFIDKGIPLLVKLAEGIGMVVGALIAGFIGGVSLALPLIGLSLSLFAVSIQPFLALMSNVDPRAIEGVKSILAMIVMLTAAELLNKIVGFLTGSKKGALGDLAKELKGFGDEYKKFADAVDGVDNDKALKAAKAAKLLAETMNELPSTGGIWQDIAGEKGGLVQFGLALVGFAPGLCLFAAMTSVVKDWTPVISAAKAAKALGEMAGSLPNDGGFLGTWVGENGLADFGTALASFGPNLVTFANSVAQITDFGAVKDAIKVSTALGEMATKLPNDGGFLGAWVGNNGLKDFGTQLESFGGSLSKFGTKVAKMKAQPITDMIPVMTSLSKFATELPETGGILSFWIGDNGLQNFGIELEAFGKSLWNYYFAVNGINTVQLIAITNAMTPVIGVMNALPEEKLFSGKVTLTKLGSHLEGFGVGLSSFYENIKEINVIRLKATVEALKLVTEAIKTASVMDSSSASKFSKAMSSIAKISIEDFTSSFKDGKENARIVVAEYFKAAIDQVYSSGDLLKSNFTKTLSACLAEVKSKAEGFKTAGKNVATSLVEGIGGDLSASATHIDTMLTKCIATIKSFKTSFYDAGVYSVEGYAEGVLKGTKASGNSGKALGKAALNGAIHQLDIRSPSREFGKLGTLSVAGFVNNLLTGGKQAYVAGTELGNSASSGLQLAVGKITSFIDGNININPTIKPVMDLSEIQAGSTMLDTMVNRARSVSVSSRIADSQNAKYRIQNGDGSRSSQVEYTFNQTNNSPRALSRVEIYRQTKNQFALMKGVVSQV